MKNVYQCARCWEEFASNFDAIYCPECDEIVEAERVAEVNEANDEIKRRRPSRGRKSTGPAPASAPTEQKKEN